MNKLRTTVITKYYSREEQLEMFQDPDKTKVYNLWLMSVFPLLKKIANIKGTGMDDEVFADLYFWFLDNIKYFDPNILPLAGFTSMICNQRIRQNRIKRKSAKLPTESIGNRDFGHQSEHLDILDLPYYLQKVQKVLTEEEYEIWYQRGIGYWPREISKKNGKETKVISQIYQKAKDKLKN